MYNPVQRSLDVLGALVRVLLSVRLFLLLRGKKRAKKDLELSREREGPSRSCRCGQEEAVRRSQRAWKLCVVLSLYFGLTCSSKLV